LAFCKIVDGMTRWYSVLWCDRIPFFSEWNKYYIIFISREKILPFLISDGINSIKYLFLKKEILWSCLSWIIQRNKCTFTYDLFYIGFTDVRTWSRTQFERIMKYKSQSFTSSIPIKILNFLRSIKVQWLYYMTPHLIS